MQLKVLLKISNFLKLFPFLYILTEAYPPIANSCMEFYKLGIAPKPLKCLNLSVTAGSLLTCCWNNLDNTTVSYLFKIITVPPNIFLFAIAQSTKPCFRLPQAMYWKLSSYFLALSWCNTSWVEWKMLQFSSKCEFGKSFQVFFYLDIDKLRSYCKTLH